MKWYDTNYSPGYTCMVLVAVRIPVGRTKKLVIPAYYSNGQFVDDVYKEHPEKITNVYRWAFLPTAP